MKRNIFHFAFVLLFLLGCSNLDNNGVTKNQELDITEKLLISSGDQQKLIEFYKLNINKNSEYKAKLVDLYLELDDLSSAQLYQNTYTSDELKKASYLLTQAKIAYKNKEYDLALMVLEKYKKQNGDMSEFYMLRGRIHAQMNLYSQAIDDFESGKKVGVSDREANNNIAFVKMMQKDFISARNILEKLYNDFPNDAKIESNYLLTLINLEQFDIAFAILKSKYSDQQAMQLLSALIQSINDNGSRKKINEDLNQCISTALESKDNSIDVLDDSIKKDEQKFNPIAMHAVDSNKKSIGIVYRIQLMATTEKNNISAVQMRNWHNEYGDVYLFSSGIWHKYSVGNFNSFKKAKEFLHTINVKDAFIVNNGLQHIKVAYD
ncbi:MAG: tetratricopeptide repeat protein [Vibrio sp.]|uniref:tetratricopeptide repeat protein n=1 Tax=Vibrio sp. TaxID=678 RepID=UPI003A88394F